MGTAGHVDHGKTALIRALTGIECDTHREEKTRGITINLGFAHLKLSGGDTVGIVDVPGHKDFVNTMVSGASGIDFTMLVVAADEGVMPQTREHLGILRLLGISRGLVAITKTDLVDQEVRMLVKEEVAELLEGTSLEGVPLVEVSSVTGEGIAELRQSIEEVTRGIQGKAPGEVFRMFIDRVFTVKGFGTVITGSVLSGVLAKEDEVFLEPGGTQLRVRRLERHGAPVDSVTAGDRASINLVGLDKEDFHRGMSITDRPLRSTTLLDCSLHLFETARPLRLWSRVSFLLGTYEAQVRIHLMDADRLRGGEKALVQIHLPSSLVSQSGDRFVIRNTSGDITLGGGEVIDAAPLHHRRRKAEVVQVMERIAEGKLSELIAQEVRKRPFAISLRELADRLNVSAEEVEKELAGTNPEEVLELGSSPELLLIDSTHFQRLAKAVRRRIETFHRAHPLQPGGPSTDELVSALGLAASEESRRFMHHLLEQEHRAGRIKPVDHTWALRDHEVKLDPLLERQAGLIESMLRESGLQAPIMADVTRRASKERIDEKRLSQILSFLRRSGKAYQAEGVFLHADIVDPIRKELVCTLDKTPAGLTVAAFRDLIGGNRKICLLLYSLFDSEGLTRREGDVRVLTDTGRKRISEFGCGSS